MQSTNPPPDGHRGWCLSISVMSPDDAKVSGSLKWRVTGKPLKLYSGGEQRKIICCDGGHQRPLRTWISRSTIDVQTDVLIFLVGSAS